MELIEAKTAKEFASTFYNDPILKMAVNAVVDKVHKMEIVNCRDCKYCSRLSSLPNDIFCTYLFTEVICPDDFCSRGERK